MQQNGPAPEFRQMCARRLTQAPRCSTFAPMVSPATRLFFATLLVAFLGGCATLPSSPPSQAIAIGEPNGFIMEPLAEPTLKPDLTAVGDPTIGSEVVMRALGLIGRKYRYGGNNPESGLDCSGLVRWVFEDKIAMELPRNSLAMSRLPAPDVRKDELLPGDLVFFRTRGRVVSHVGIYIGDGRFVHAATGRSKVRIDRLDATYWRSRFVNAKRVIAPTLVGDQPSGTSSFPATPGALDNAASGATRVAQ